MSFERSLINAIRDSLTSSRTLILGNLGVFRVVHREPMEVVRQDGSVILTPPANVLNFEEDHNLRTTDTSVVNRLVNETDMSAAEVHNAIDGFTSEILVKSRTDAYNIPGFGLFKRTGNGLSFDPANELAKDVNLVYDGLKAIELVNAEPTATQHLKPVNRKTDDEGDAPEELIKVLDGDGVATSPKTKAPAPPTDETGTTHHLRKIIGRDDDSGKISEELRKVEQDEEINISIPLRFLRKKQLIQDEPVSRKTEPVPSEKVENTEDNGLENMFRDQSANKDAEIGFDDGLENFGRRRRESINIIEEPALPQPPVDEENIDIYREQTQEVEQEFESLKEESSDGLEHSADIEPTPARSGFGTSRIKIGQLDWEEPQDQAPLTGKTEVEPIKSLEDLKREIEGFYFGGNVKKSPEPQSTIKTEVKPEPAKTKAEDPDVEFKALVDSVKGTATTDTTETEKVEVSEEKTEVPPKTEAPASTAQAESVVIDAPMPSYVKKRTFPTDKPDSLPALKKTDGDGSDTSHFDDNIINPVLPGKSNDKGLRVALVVASVLLFGIMLYLVYTLFPAEEPTFVRQQINQGVLPGAGSEEGEEGVQQGRIGLADLAPNPTDPQSFDDILLELHRPSRGGLFGLYGDFNHNVRPFFGIILFTSSFRSEAEEKAKEFRDKEWRTHLMSSERSDGTRVWRVMVGQFSTLSEANTEARLLPPPYRNEFLVFRYNPDE